MSQQPVKGSGRHRRHYLPNPTHSSHTALTLTYPRATKSKTYDADLSLALLELAPKSFAALAMQSAGALPWALEGKKATLLLPPCDESEAFVKDVKRQWKKRPAFLHDMTFAVSHVELVTLFVTSYHSTRGDFLGKWLHAGCDLVVKDIKAYGKASADRKSPFLVTVEDSKAAR
ncbi:MAG: hypothetical protein GY737_18935, partial [Desulfobacteraceae bacterium]|nr:hypothetical protein [Desulfobacteraceae bacterium]